VSVSPARKKSITASSCGRDATLDTLSSKSRSTGAPRSGLDGTVLLHAAIPL
jgi:hypothetical protein